MSGTTPRGYPFPLYSDPADFPDAMLDLATAVDTDMDALFDRLTAGYNMAAVSVRSSVVNPAVANNTDVDATYVDELYDNTGMANLGTSNTTLTFTQTGLYLASARVTFSPNGSGPNARKISIVTNGTLGTVGRRTMPGDLAVGTPVATACLFWAAAGDTIKVVQRQNSGALLQTTTRSLMVARMGAL